jgi:hypothetical protein
MLAHAGQPAAEMEAAPLASLQRRRGRFGELGAQLEAYWRIHPNRDQRDRFLEMAAEAYRSAGNTQGEMQALGRSAALSTRARDRYFALLKANRPQELIDRAARDEASVNFAVASGDASLALGAIESRAASALLFGRALTRRWRGCTIRARRPKSARLSPARSAAGPWASGSESRWTAANGWPATCGSITAPAMASS